MLSRRGFFFLFYFCFLIVNWIMSAEMVCGLKVLRLNESICSHSESSYRKMNECVILAIQILYFTKEKSLTHIKSNLHFKRFLGNVFVT